MNIFVAGAAGFIGTNFVYYIQRKHRDWKIVGYDALTYAGNAGNLREAMKNDNFTFICGDIRDRKSVDEAFTLHSPDIVINFAAESHVDRSIESPAIFIETNVLGTEVLLDESMKHNVKRFHQISTDEVYGDLPLDRPELKFTEESPLRPSSPYSASKAAADLLVLSYHRTYGMDVTISRCSNNYGKYQHQEKLIPKTISCALRNDSIPVYGNGENVRDWIYVEDHCRAVEIIITKGRSGEIYNVGSNNEVSNISMIRKILKSMDRSDELITFTRDRKGHDKRYAIDNSKLQRELGPIAFSQFDEKLEETVKWYSKSASF